MNTIEKQNIVAKLQEYCKIKGSQNKAANSIGVSSATLSQMLSGKLINWELINDEMWRKVAAQIGYDASGWVTVETRAYKRMVAVLRDVQENALVKAVIGGAGSGKTQTIEKFVQSSKNVFHLSCSEFWNRKCFLTELLRALGRDVYATGTTAPEMITTAISILKKLESPIIIIDEADKLNDQVLYFFITLYNKLENHCGIILCATPYLERRILKGVTSNRKGYGEIHSRIGRRFIPLQVVNGEDVAAVCMANGITDERQIEKIYYDCENDLRRVKDLVHAFKKKSLKTVKTPLNGKETT